MPPIHHIQPTFAGGEFAPSLYARIDIAKYSTGLKTAKNFIIHPHGGASNRPGTKYAAEVKDSTKKTRVIPFEFSTEQAYVIEMGEGYFRFFKDQGAILATAANGVPTYNASATYVAGDFVISSATAYKCILTDTGGHTPASSPTYWTPTPIYEVLSPYQEEDLPNVKYTQSADVLYLFHPDYAIRKLTRTDHAAWTLTVLDFKNGPFMPSNTVSTKTLTSSATAVGNTNLTASSALFDVTSPSLHIGALFRLIHTIPAQSLVVDYNYGSSATSSSIKCGGTWRIMSHGTWTGTVKIEKSTDGGTTWSELRAFTSKDNFNINTYGEDEEYCLIRLNATDIQAAPAIAAAWDKNASYLAEDWVTDGGVLYRCLATHNQNVGYADWNAATAYTIDAICTHVLGSGLKATYQAIQAGTNKHPPDNPDYWKDITESFPPDTSSGFWQAKTCRVELSSDPFEQTGIVKILTVSSATSATASILTEVGSTAATSDWAEGSWSGANGYPSCGLFYQDRFCCAATYSEPQTIWFSKTASYEDFGRSTPLEDTDGISINLPSRKMNGIRSLIPLGEIIAFTSSSEWSIGPGSTGILTPTSIQTKLEGSRGCSKIDPVMVSNRAIFSQPMDSVVCDMGYDYNSSGYATSELSIMSNHLFESFAITEMAFQMEPDSLVWLVRDDGGLLSLTYLREQEVLAWTPHNTGESTDASGNVTQDSFESICSIPGDGYNEVWVVVKRGSKRYIEYFTHRMASFEPEDQFFVDCGYAHDGVSSTTEYLSGLDWLAGRTVSILADGNVIRNVVIAVPTAWDNAVAYEIADYVNYSGKNYRCLATNTNKQPNTETDYWVESTSFVRISPPAIKINVGLPYIADLETLDVSMQMPDGTLQDRLMQIGQLTIRFLRSRGGWIGTEPDELDEIIQRTTEDYDDPINLFSGDYQAPINGAFDTKGRVFIRQLDPLPMTILAVMPQVTIGD